MKNSNKLKSTSLTEGPIFKNIIKFSIPLILTGILQQLYNTFDSIIIGKFGSSASLAAVGSSSSFINLTINLFIGISLGTSIVVSQYFGARDEKCMKKAVNTSVALAILCGIIMTIIGVLITKPALVLLGTPSEVLPYSVKYLTIYFCGTLPALLYNFLAGILRATGDSKRPLFYLIVSAVLNVLLNLLFVVNFKMDVSGVALATVISQIICCILALYRLMTVSDAYKIKIKEIKFNKIFIGKILKIGIPAGINSCLFSFSNVLIQSTINSFGTSAVAGSAASSSIENFIYMPLNAIAAATTTFVGQNKGAGNFKRIEQGVKASATFSFITGLILGSISYFIAGETLISLFSDEKNVISFGMERMGIISLSYCICGIMEVLNGTIRGSGDSVIPMFISIFGVCVIRLLWIYAFIPSHDFKMIFFAYPVSWTITSFLLFVYYKKGKKRWQSI